MFSKHTCVARLVYASSYVNIFMGFCVYVFSIHIRFARACVYAFAYVNIFMCFVCMCLVYTLASLVCMCR